MNTLALDAKHILTATGLTPGEHVAATFHTVLADGTDAYMDMETSRSVPANGTVTFQVFDSEIHQPGQHGTLEAWIRPANSPVDSPPPSNEIIKTEF